MRRFMWWLRDTKLWTLFMALPMSVRISMAIVSTLGLVCLVGLAAAIIFIPPLGLALLIIALAIVLVWAVFTIHDYFTYGEGQRFR